MKLRIGLGELMDRIVRGIDMKEEVNGVKMRKLLTSLENPDNSTVHIRSDRSERIKEHLCWERKEVGMSGD